MPFQLEISPTALLAMWAGGMAVGAAFVARWKVVGPGFLWTAGAAALLAGGFAAFAGPWAATAAALLVVAIALAKRPGVAGLIFAGSGALYLVSAMEGVNSLLVLTGAVALGGTTCEMLLGHWYLIDPKLPRWALRRLDGAGIAGLVIDAGVVIALGGLAGGGALRWAFLALAAMGVLMMVGVWFSLKERGYEGVMAATGLSYLSVLTALGSVAMGRFLLG
jgi:hypothetical protein